MFKVMNKLFLNFSNNFDINELDIEPFSLKIQNNRYDNHSQIETVKMPKLKPEDVTAISIHIRLTDYKKHLKHYYNMSTASKEYLSNAIDYMDQKYDVSSTDSF